MVMAMYKENRVLDPEFIRVHKYDDNTLHIEGITNSYAKEIGDVFNNLEEVEAFLRQRSRAFGYSLIMK